jgi:hypothetical protein
MVRWGDSEISSGGPQSIFNDSHYAWVWGYHYRRVDITIGNTIIRLFEHNRPTVEMGEPFANAWLSLSNSGVEALPPIVGKATIAANAAGSYRVTVSAAITCMVNDDHVEQWAADTYTKIRAAYDAARQAHDDASVSMFAPTDLLGSADSPVQNTVTVHEELKRQIVELLLGEPFTGYAAVARPATGGPHLDPAALQACAPYIQMMEQAFEWENITYICYPYFWADRDRWVDLASRRSADPDFQAFLRAGSARVVVPARPHFEDVVNAFLDYGVVWGGGPAPSPGDPQYVSIADEIRAMQQAPDGGEAGESWEVRLPTTLVWLDDDSHLPKVNPGRRLTEPADPMCPPPATGGS